MASDYFDPSDIEDPAYEYLTGEGGGGGGRSDIDALIADVRSRYPVPGQPGPAAPPARPYTPLTPEPEGGYRAALDNILTPLEIPGRILGTAGRGVGAGLALAKGTLMGDPLRDFELAPGAMERGVGGDIAGAFGLTEPTVRAPSVGQQAVSGIETLGRLAGGGGELSPESRAAWEREHRGLSSAEAVARPLGAFAADIATDPLATPFGGALGDLGKVVREGRAAETMLANYGLEELVAIGSRNGMHPDAVTHELARAIKAGRGAENAKRAVELSFVPGMAKGAVQGLGGAVETYQQEGLTPAAIEQGVTGGLEAIFGTVMLKEALSGRRPPFRYEEPAHLATPGLGPGEPPPVEAEGRGYDVPPPRGMPGAPPWAAYGRPAQRQPAEGPIDAEFVPPEQLPGEGDFPPGMRLPPRPPPQLPPKRGGPITPYAGGPAIPMGEPISPEDTLFEGLEGRIVPGQPRLRGEPTPPVPTDLEDLAGGDLLTFSPAAAAAAEEQGVAVPPHAVRGPGAPPRTIGELATWRERMAALEQQPTEPEQGYKEALDPPPEGVIEPEIVSPEQLGPGEDLTADIPPEEGYGAPGEEGFGPPGGEGAYSFHPDLKELIDSAYPREDNPPIHPDYYQAVWDTLRPESKAAIEQFGIFDIPEPYGQNVAADIDDVMDRLEGFVGDSLAEQESIDVEPTKAIEGTGVIPPGRQLAPGAPSRPRTPLQPEDVEGLVSAIGPGEQRAGERRRAAGAPPEGGERRKAERRAKVAAELELPEQHAAVERVAEAEEEARTDELTGLGNRRAFEEQAGDPHHPRKRIAAWDVEGLKWANDNLPGGHKMGDEILKRVADAFRDEGLDAYRTGGDEFYSFHLDGDQAEKAIARVKARLADEVLQAHRPDGTMEEYQGIGIWGGHGDGPAAAENALNAAKERAVGEGRRAPRGERPRSLSQAPAAGHEVQAEAEGRPQEVVPRIPGRERAPSAEHTFSGRNYLAEERKGKRRKRPWQMTLDEFAWRHAIFGKGKAPEAGDPIPQDFVDLHETTLRNAIEVGRPVPQELRDLHPGLKDTAPVPERVASIEGLKADMAKHRAEREAKGKADLEKFDKLKVGQKVMFDYGGDWPVEATIIEKDTTAPRIHVSIPAHTLTDGTKVPDMKPWGRMGQVKELDRHWEDLSDREKAGERARVESELKAIDAREYPVGAVFAGDRIKVLGPAARFPPYDTHPAKVEGWKGAFQLLAERDGEKFIVLAHSVMDLDGKPWLTRVPRSRETKSPFERMLEGVAKGAKDPLADLHESVRNDLRAARKHGEPPVPEGKVRLYRGETAPGAEKRPVPDWVKDHVDYEGIQGATGRWFAPTRTEAEWYARDAAVGGRPARVTYVDVPETDVAAWLANNFEGARRWSAKPLEEFLVPREIADKAKVLLEPHEQPAAGTAEAPIEAETAEDVERAGEQVEPEPSAEQADAGNYPKGHIKWNGLDVSIETPKGGMRLGQVSAEDVRGITGKGEPRRIDESLEHVAQEIDAGNRAKAYKSLRNIASSRGPSALTRLAERAWEVEMPAHYGYVRRSEGVDGEQVDVFMGDNPASDKVFIIDQADADSDRFDEHKIMLGFDDQGAAGKAYRSSFSDEKGAKRQGGITPMSVERLKEWLASGSKKPLSDRRKKVVMMRPAWPPGAASQPSWSSVPWAGEEKKETPQVPPLPGMAPLGKPPAAPPRKLNADESQAEYTKLKAALTRAENTKDPRKILAEAERALARFDDFEHGWPDNWSRWQRAKDDAEYAIQRQEPDKDLKDLAAPAEKPESVPAARLPEGWRVEKKHDGWTITDPQGADQGAFPKAKIAIARAHDLAKGRADREAVTESEGAAAGRYEKGDKVSYKGRPATVVGRGKGRLGDKLQIYHDDDPQMTLYVDARKLDDYLKAKEGDLDLVLEDEEPEAPGVPPQPEAPGAGEPETIEEGESPYKGEGQEGSAYEGEKLADLLPTVEDEQIGRLTAIGKKVEAIAEAIKHKRPKRVEQLEKSLNSDLQVYRGTYNEVIDASSDATATAMRGRVEKAVGSTLNMLLDELKRSRPETDVLTDEGEEATVEGQGGPGAGIRSRRPGEPEGVEGAPPAEQPTERPEGRGPGSLEDVQPDLLPEDEGEEPAGEGTRPAGGTRQGGLLPERPVGPGLRGRRGTGKAGVDASTRAADDVAKVEAPPPEDTTEYVEDIAEGSGAATPATIGNISKPIVAKKNRGTDYVIKDFNLGEVGKKAAVKANILAIKTLKAIEAEDRPATPEEQDILGHYTGWGRLPQVFVGGYDPDAGGSFYEDMEALKDLLTEDEFKAAQASTINAHYTSPIVVGQQWRGVERLGITKHSRILEPAIGVGNYYGMQPKHMLPAQRTGVEMDPLSARIAKVLYPRAAIINKPFQDASLPADHYDLTMTNVPFARIPIRDPSLPPEARQSLHDYFIAKSLALTRPGGIVSVISSHYTMDKQDSRFREYLAKRANLVGMIRLPSTAFKKNAGTEVVTDIIFLRKLLPGEAPGSNAWTGTVTFKGKDKQGYPADGRYSQYYADNPHMVLGEHSMAGEMYGGKGEYTVKGELEPEKLHIAVNKLPKDVVQPWSPVKDVPAGDLVEAPGTVKPNAFTVHEGKLKVKRGEFLEPVSVNKADEARIRGMIDVRDATRELLDAQVLDEPDAEIKRLQAKLNRIYDGYVRNHGPLSHRSNTNAFEDDPEADLLLALEDVDNKTKKVSKAKIFSERTIQPYVKATSADSATSALSISLRETGGVNLAHMAKLTGKSEEALSQELSGASLIFRNPQGDAWETADAYLSGNVRKKLEAARAAAKTDDAFEPNVKALEAAQLPDRKPSEIMVRLGSPWVPVDTVQGFIAEILETRPDRIQVHHALTMGGWAIKVPDALLRTVLATQRWGAPGADTEDLIGNALNMKQTVIRVEIDKGKTVVDKQATLVAQQKQQEIQDRFAEWIWEDPKRGERHLRIFNDLYNSIRNRKYDGSHLTFPGLDRKTLRGKDLGQHQKNAAWRTIQANPKTNVLINQPPGAGKTIGLIVGIMERKRLGLSQKPAVSVPNHVVSQWRREWRRTYPRANLLIVTEKNITPKKRQQLMARIATGKYDGIIMSWESLGKLPVRKETYKRFVDEQIAELEAAIMEAMAVAAEQNPGRGKVRKSRLIKQMEAAKQRLEERLDEYLAMDQKDLTVAFEDLGIDFLAVDEAHGFKNLATPSKIGVAGIKTDGNKRAMDLYMKTRYLNEHGGVIAFATATPIANTVGESFVVQKFLQPELLKEMGLSHFDSWAGNFGQVINDTEYTATGKFQQKARFARFNNVVGLSTMMAETMDTVLPEHLDLPLPKIVGGKPEVVEVDTPPGMEEYLADLADRHDALRGNYDPKVDNHLKINSDGRKASIDMRLVRPELPEPPNSKLNVVADGVHALWEQSAGRRGTQIIFLDIGTPKKPRKADFVEGDKEDEAEQEAEAQAFDAVVAPEAKKERAQVMALYADLKDKLVKRGIPKEEVAFIHDYKTPEQKAQLNDNMNDGTIRVLIGSTDKMSTGLNIQERLYAMHMPGPPWRPDQVRQAEGRIERQGNRHFDWGIPVHIIRYVTTKSYDAVLWGHIERKNRFVEQFFSGDPTLGTMEDLGNATVGYAEAKALATGNPLILEKVNLETEYGTLSALYDAYQNGKYNNSYKLSKLEAVPAYHEGRIEALRAEQKRYEADKEANPEFSIDVMGKTYTDRTEAAKAMHAAIGAAIAKERTARKLKDSEKLTDFKLPLGKFRSFPLTFEISTYGTQEYISVGELLEARVTEAEGEGILRSIQGVLSALPQNIEWERGEIAKALKETRDLKAEMAKPFPKMEQYQRIGKRLREIDKQLGITQEEKEAELGVADDEGGGEGPPEPPKKGAAPPEEEPPDEEDDNDPEAAKQRILDRAAKAGKKMNLGVDPAETAANLRDLGIIGGDFIRRGLRRFGVWARRMLASVGDLFTNLREKLRDVWTRSVARFRRQGAAERPEAARERAPEPEGPETRTPPRETAGVPFVLTHKMKARLRDLGYSERQIEAMAENPQEAHDILAAGRQAGARGGPDYEARWEAMRREGIGSRRRPGEPRVNVDRGTARDVADSVRDYETAEPIGKPGGRPDLGINVERLTSEEAVNKAAKAAAEAMDKELSRARGYRSWETAEERAAFLRALGYTEKEIAASRTAFRNDAEAMAAKEILAEATRKAKDAAEAVRRAELAGDEGDLAGRLRDLDEAAAKMAFIAAHFARRTAEVARTLASFRKQASDLSPEERIIRAVLRERGAVSPEFIAALLRAKNVEAAMRAIRAETRPGIKGWFHELYINGLLSGLTTPISNLVGSVAGIAGQVSRYSIAAVLETLRGGGEDRAFSESFGAMAGFKAGLPDAWRVFKDHFINERLRLGARDRLEYSVGAIPGKIGKAIRTPGRLVGATDLALKMISAQAELYVRAQRLGRALANRQGLTGSAKASYANARAQEVIDAFTSQTHKIIAGEPFETRYPEIANAMKQAADYNTYNKRLGKLGSAIVETRQKDPTGFAKIFFPFIRTPINIAKYTLEHTPLNFLRLWAKWSELDPSERSDELAKPIMGTLLLYGFAQMAKEGLITGGGPVDKRENELKRKTGWSPYSFYWNGAYVPFSRIEPLGSLLGMAADVVEATDEKSAGDMVQKMMASVTANLINKTFLHGAQNVAQAWSDPKRYMKGFLEDTERSLVPNILGRAATAIDPVVRQTSPTDLSAIKARIPFLSKTLPAKRGGTGEEIVREGEGILGALERFASPFPVTHDKGPEADLERALLDVDYAPSPPAHSVTIPGTGGKKLELNQAEYARLQKYDEAATKYLRRVVATPAWDRLNSEQQRLFLKRVYSKASDAGRQSLWRSASIRARAREVARGVSP